MSEEFTLPPAVRDRAAQAAHECWFSVPWERMNAIGHGKWNAVVDAVTAVVAPELQRALQADLEAEHEDRMRGLRNAYHREKEAGAEMLSRALGVEPGKRQFELEPLIVAQRERVAQLQAENEALSRKLSAAQTEIRGCDYIANELRKGYNDAIAERDQFKARIVELKQEVDDLTQEIRLVAGTD